MSNFLLERASQIEHFDLAVVAIGYNHGPVLHDEEADGVAAGFVLLCLGVEAANEAVCFISVRDGASAIV